jgi:hypothetical protein
LDTGENVDGGVRVVADARGLFTIAWNGAMGARVARTDPAGHLLADESPPGTIHFSDLAVRADGTAVIVGERPPVYPDPATLFSVTAVVASIGTPGAAFAPPEVIALQSAQGAPTVAFSPTTGQPEMMWVAASPGDNIVAQISHRTS